MRPLPKLYATTVENLDTIVQSVKIENQQNRTIIRFHLKKRFLGLSKPILDNNKIDHMLIEIQIARYMKTIIKSKNLRDGHLLRLLGNQIYQHQFIQIERFNKMRKMLLSNGTQMTVRILILNPLSLIMKMKIMMKMTMDMNMNDSMAAALLTLTSWANERNPKIFTKVDSQILLFPPSIFHFLQEKGMKNIIVSFPVK